MVAVTPRRLAADKRQGNGGECLWRVWEGERRGQKDRWQRDGAPLYTGAAEVGDGPTSGAVWKEQRGGPDTMSAAMQRGGGAVADTGLKLVGVGTLPSFKPVQTESNNSNSLKFISNNFKIDSIQRGSYEALKI
jgi:hypothetical protein